jgi:hypothetical protein
MKRRKENGGMIKTVDHINAALASISSMQISATHCYILVETQIYHP